MLRQGGCEVSGNLLADGAVPRALFKSGLLGHAVVICSHSRMEIAAIDVLDQGWLLIALEMLAGWLMK